MTTFSQAVELACMCNQRVSKISLNKPLKECKVMFWSCADHAEIFWSSKPPPYSFTWCPCTVNTQWHNLYKQMQQHSACPRFYHRTEMKRSFKAEKTQVKWRPLRKRIAARRRWDGFDFSLPKSQKDLLLFVPRCPSGLIWNQRLQAALWLVVAASHSEGLECTHIRLLGLQFAYDCLIRP